MRPLCYKYISYIWVQRNPAGALAFNYRGFYPLCHISKPINKIRSAIWSAIDGYFMPSCILNLFSWNGKGKCFKMMNLTLFSLHTLMQYLQSQNIPVSGKLVRHFRSWLIVVMNQNCYLLKYNWHWQENFYFLKMLTPAQIYQARAVRIQRQLKSCVSAGN